MDSVDRNGNQTVLFHFHKRLEEIYNLYPVPCISRGHGRVDVSHYTAAHGSFASDHP